MKDIVGLFTKLMYWKYYMTDIFVASTTLVTEVTTETYQQAEWET